MTEVNGSIDERGRLPAWSRPPGTLQLGAEDILDGEPPGAAGIEHRVQRRLLMLTMPAHRFAHHLQQHVSRDVGKYFSPRRPRDGDAVAVSDRSVEDVPEARLIVRRQVYRSWHPRSAVDIELEAGVRTGRRRNSRPVQGELQSARWAVRRHLQHLFDDRLPRRLVHLFVTDGHDVDVALSSDVAAKGDRPHEVRTNEAVGEYQAQHRCDLVAECRDVIKRSHPPIIPRRAQASSDHMARRWRGGSCWRVVTNAKFHRLAMNQTILI